MEIALLEEHGQDELARLHLAGDGIKFILVFGSGPISVLLISEIYSITLEFTYLFIINAVMMGLVSVFILFLPIQNNQKHATLD